MAVFKIFQISPREYLENYKSNNETETFANNKTKKDVFVYCQI